MASLYRAMDALDAKGRAYLVDPVLDPINFGFMQSLERYAQVRRERPDAEILMGTGNLTELTDADTTGITAVLLGIASELHIRNVLVVQVSPHTRRTVEEHDLARRIMYASARITTCRRTMPTDCLPCIRAGRSRKRRTRSPTPRARCATRTSASKSPRTASMSITATAITWRKMPSTLFPSLAWSKDGRARLLSRRRTGQGRNRLQAGQALRAGRAARLGRCRRRAGGRQDAG